MSYTSKYTGKEIDDKLDQVGEVAIGSNVPLGTVIPYMGKTAPREYLACDGTEYNISDYLDLANYIAEEFGMSNFFGGDGETTFAVPDLRNEFLRGFGDRTNEVGIHQDATEIPRLAGALEGNNKGFCIRDVTTDIWHKFDDKHDEVIGLPNGEGKSMNPSISGASDASYASGIDDEGKISYRYTTRPTNVAVLFCIKYTPAGFEAGEPPIATKDTLGGIKVGEGLEITEDGTLSVLETLNKGNAKYYSNSATNVSCKASSDTNVVGITLEAGTYVITGAFRHNEKGLSCSYGITGVSIRNADSHSDMYTYETITSILKLEETTDIYLVVYINGTTDKVIHSATIKAVKLDGISSNSGTNKTILWEGKTTTIGDILTLSDSIENYDFIYLETECIAGGVREVIMTPTILDTNSIITNGYGTDSVYAGGIMDNGTDVTCLVTMAFLANNQLKLQNKFEVGTNTDTGIVKVVGIKLGGSSSSEENYSTSEQRIGTWIDGKPIYRKIYTLDLTIGVERQYTTVEADFAVGKKILTIRGNAVFSFDNKQWSYEIPVYDRHADTGIQFLLHPYIDNDNLMLCTKWNSSQDYSFIIIVEYTKTTD